MSFSLSMSDNLFRKTPNRGMCVIGEIDFSRNLANTAKRQLYDAFASYSCFPDSENFFMRTAHTGRGRFLNKDTPHPHTVWMEVVPMWTAWLLLTLNGLFFTLRLAGNTGSFPRALTREEEQDCLDRMAKGDDDARDMLIEHNLRLVAHIVKKG